MTLLSRVGNVQGLYLDDYDDPLGESPAIEVLNYQDPNGYFAST